MQSPDAPSEHRADGLVFAAANLWAYLRHPWLALTACRRLRRLVNFARPTTHGEMMQWRKVFDHNPLFVIHVDKLAAKRWARQRCPDLATAEVLWEGNDPELLPEALISPGHVIKSNNGSARNYLPHRGIWPRHVFLRRTRRWLRRHPARLGEWAYGEVEPRLYVERLIGRGQPIMDLNIRTFGGEVAVAFLAHRWKTPDGRAAYLDPAGNRLMLDVDGPGSLPLAFPVPPAFHVARSFAEQLGKGVDHVRVDFMLDGDDIYFNELTHYSASGYGDEDRLGLGSMLLGRWLASIEKGDFLTHPRQWPLSLYQSAFRRYAKAAVSALSAAPAPPGPAP